MRKGIVWVAVACIMVAAVVSFGLVACGSKSSSDPAQAATTYIISGTVTSSSAALQGVTMTLSGASAATATTDASGNFAFSGIANGSYTVTPSKTAYTFSPVSKTITINGADTTGNTFTATADLSGYWAVTGTEVVGSGNTTSASWSLTQSGTTISGSFICGSTSTASAISGSVNANNVNLFFSDSACGGGSGCSSAFTGTISGSTVSGTWSATDGTSGTWSMSKLSSNPCP